MIDCENEVYTAVAKALRKAFPKIKISGEYLLSPSEFPYVSFEMVDNYPLDGYQSSKATESMVRVVFEANIYSNKSQGKKSECKKIAQIINDTLFSMNFIRISQIPVPNMENASIYRITGRYQANTDGKHFYRR